MTKVELIREVARQSKLPKKRVEQIIDVMTNIIARELNRRNKVQLMGFGSFGVSTRVARKGINPRTGETIDLPESNHVRFKAGNILKRAIN